MHHTKIILIRPTRASILADGLVIPHSSLSALNLVTPVPELTSPRCDLNSELATCTAITSIHPAHPMADDSDSSSLSSAPDEEVKKLAPIFFKAKQAKNHYVPKSSPPRPKRQASPPHEEVLADNADIAVSRQGQRHENARSRRVQSRWTRAR